ncbi:MAG: spore germination protein [Oscillospiraceae bacterium]|nr:spore germination protein [Oscillospiraceae bacterium]
MTSPNGTNFKDTPLVKSIDENIENIKRILSNSSDLLLNPFLISGIKCNLVCFEGMVSTSTITNLILNPMTEISLPEESSPDDIFEHIKNHMLLTVDRAEVTKYGDLIPRLMSGFAIILIDGMDKTFAFGVQGYETRGIDEPSSEGNIYGSHEGFVETVRTNMSLVRRRIKSPLLVFELFSVTDLSNVDVIVAYMSDRVPKKLVSSVKKKLKGMKLETVLSSGYIEPFLNDTKLSMFSGVSKTERPDVFCAKILEGRIGILIEGTPFALVLPALFIENFQTLDDYTFRPYYTTLVRWIRYLAFFAAVFLPAVYVAVVTFHPELFNHTMLVMLAEAEELAPLPLAAEAFLVLVFYEIIREAGVRLPKSVGGAVSIVGGLIIGDAAVSAGVISNPLLLVCAISVTASFVIPSLNQPVTVLRFISVIAGGIAGLYGIALVASVILVNICSLESVGAPIMSPLSPFTPRAMRDVLTRAGFRTLGRRTASVEDLKGVNMDGEGGNKS